MGDEESIVSLYADHPELLPRIDEFVIGLGERIDALQDFESLGDWKQVQFHARAIIHAAAELGFPIFATQAGLVEAACVTPDPGLLRELLVELTALARRVRLGHRGASS